MRDDIKQRSAAIQKLISESKIDISTKTLLSQNLATSASSINGMSTLEKINALCAGVYQISESLALLSIKFFDLPCHSEPGHVYQPNKPSTPTDITKPSYAIVLDFILKLRWVLFALISVIFIGILISPHLQDITKEATRSLIINQQLKRSEYSETPINPKPLKPKEMKEIQEMKENRDADYPEVIDKIR